MRFLLRIGFCLLVILSLSQCRERSIEKKWYLMGSNIELYLGLEEKTMILSEGKQLIFKAAIEDYEYPEKNKLKVRVKMVEIGALQEYQLKYRDFKEFILWFELNEGRMKMIFNKYFDKPYFFSTRPENMTQSDFRLLRPFELADFRNSAGIRDARQDYNFQIYINKKPLMTPQEVQDFEKKPNREWIRKEQGVANLVIREMTDYLTDMDTSTYWGTEDYLDLEIEVLIRDSAGKPLKTPLKIRGFYFNTGDLYKKNQYYNYHRIKDVSLHMTPEYEGNLGMAKANYNYAQSDVTLADTIDEKIVVFYQSVEANSVLIKVKDFYFGTVQDWFALFDFTIYIDVE
ncbi:MAG: hypothetical protein CVV50_03030 [Spirochaetae bacterium HGW-Spirochaetae-6]|nr:MAG: hypothetical protein CVV50_03030 [Spirochaetae bacterium HGW-Spirochaetae-6]